MSASTPQETKPTGPKDEHCNNIVTTVPVLSTLLTEGIVYPSEILDDVLVILDNQKSSFVCMPTFGGIVERPDLMDYQR